MRLPVACLSLRAVAPLATHPRISRLRRYDFDTHHQACRQLGVGIDIFSYGIEPLSLLLWWGDLTAARAGFAKVPHLPIGRGPPDVIMGESGVWSRAEQVLDAHKRILARVRQGEASGCGVGGSCFSPELLKGQRAPAEASTAPISRRRMIFFPLSLPGFAGLERFLSLGFLIAAGRR